MYFTVHKNELTAFNSNDLRATSIVPTITVYTVQYIHICMADYVFDMVNKKSAVGLPEH